MSDYSTSSQQPVEPRKPTDFQAYWKAEIESAEKAAEQFVRRGRKVSARYRSEASETPTSESDETVEFNIFWSNVETLLPATYSRRPRVEVFRRFRDQDPVGRLAGQILERALQYEIDQSTTLHTILRSTVKDRLIAGLGQVWVRYEPAFEDKPTTVPDPNNPLATITQNVETLVDETTPADYVHWQDFVVPAGRIWTELTWVGRKIYFTKDKLRLRFEKSYAKLGGDIDKVPLNIDPASLSDPNRSKEEADSAAKRALVYEIWSKEHKQLFWICKDCEYPLDITEDRFKLDGFFPCPEPLLGTTTTDKFLPVADYILYQKQIVELDTVSRRIRLLTRAMRVIGVYDATQPALKDLLSGYGENTMVPVNSWAAFAEKGGLKGVTDWLPLETVVKVLQGLYEARSQIKQVIYEITGMADIIRGASLASETLGAQEIKAKFANLRLSSRQQQVAEFVTRILQLKAELMCDRYSPETLIRISSIEQMPEAAAKPELVQQALQLLKNEKARRYRIEVASASMIELDEVDERQRRTEFMEAVSNFMNAAKNVASLHPAMMPVALEMLKFTVRGFSVGRALEGAIEDTIMTIEQELKNPKPPQPDPTEVLKKEIEKMRQDGETMRTQMTNDTKEAIAGLQAEAKERDAEASRRHEELTGQVQRVYDSQEAERGRQAQAAEASREQESAAKEQSESAMQQVAAQQAKIIDAIEQLALKAEKLKKRVPIYDKSGELLEVQEQFMQ